MMALPDSTWRLILSPPMRGYENMALDEAILESVGAGTSPPTLRLYRWEPPCLSLGYAQPLEDVDRERLGAFGWDIVRRPTGGRSILHVDELTYSISAPIDHHHVRGDILQSYRHLSTGLVAGLEKMGVDVAVQQPGSSTDLLKDNPICFEVPSPYEITAGGKKLLGSAQVRRKASLLQHGTLPLRGDISRIVQVLSYADEKDRETAARQVAQRATTVEAVTGKIVRWSDAADAMVEGFAEALGITFRKGNPNQQELRRAETLAETHYLHDAWLAKR